MFKTLLGLFGLFLLFIAVFDVDWFLNLTRSARCGYPLGKNSPRILIGIGGIITLLIALSWWE
jgi:hypothetical protein